MAAHADQAKGQPLVIFGAGGHGRVCADIANAAGFQVIGFCDTLKARGEAINGIAVIAASLGELRQMEELRKAHVFIAIGNNDRRQSLFNGAKALGLDIATLIHPSAVIAPSVTIGEGSVLMPGVIINANASVGRFAIVNTAASLDHDNRLADGAQICPGVRAAGAVTFGGNSFIGTGACIIPGVTIGERAIVGAGAVVLSDVGANERVAGNPASAI